MTSKFTIVIVLSSHPIDYISILRREGITIIHDWYPLTHLDIKSDLAEVKLLMNKYHWIVGYYLDSGVTNE